ncbi:hypothetical protein SCOR_34605 [Sulfidibacter corallicola]
MPGATGYRLVLVEDGSEQGEPWYTSEPFARRAVPSATEATLAVQAVVAGGLGPARSAAVFTTGWYPAVATGDNGSMPWLNPAVAADMKARAITPPAVAVAGKGPQPYIFALRPLYPNLQSASDVAVAPFDPDTGGLGTPQARDYQGVDMEDWAHAWLAGLDLLCTGAYVTAAYPVNPSALGRLLTAKQGLAEAVADGLSVILADQDASGAAVGSVPWKAAREVLRQRLLGDLVRAYDGTAMVQYQVGVDAPNDVANARLSGPGSLADDRDDGDIARLGNAKCSLATAEAGTLTFPLTLSRPDQDPAATLNPTYAVNEIEYHIEQVTDGYTNADWLHFVRNFAADPPAGYRVDLGTPIIPVPLRSYPAQPALAFQEALTHPAPKTLADALLWD